MMNYKHILISSFSLLLAACSGNNEDLTRYIHQVKQRKSRAIEPIPIFASLPGFKFPADENRRNPFKATNQKKRADPFAPDQRRIKQALEVYPLDALKFVGTLTQDNEIWGLIKQPDSQITRVHVGNYMGQNYGRIIMIKNNSIKLEETIKNTSGTWEKHVTTLELYTGK
jgi:type IV pilus assembly protein PilP